MSIKMNYSKHFQKIRQFWLKNEQKIILVFGLILVAAISFEAGVLKGQNYQKSALIVEKPAQCENMPDSPQTAQKTQDLTSGKASNTIGEATPANSRNCVFVGSKNSDKYYPPTCSFAKRLKPENVVCFSGDQDAVSKGYQKSTGCFK